MENIIKNRIQYLVCALMMIFSAFTFFACDYTKKNVVAIEIDLENSNITTLVGGKINISYKKVYKDNSKSQKLVYIISDTSKTGEYTGTIKIGSLEKSFDYHVSDLIINNAFELKNYLENQSENRYIVLNKNNYVLEPKHSIYLNLVKNNQTFVGIGKVNIYANYYVAMSQGMLINVCGENITLNNTHFYTNYNVTTAINLTEENSAKNFTFINSSIQVNKNIRDNVIKDNALYAGSIILSGNIGDTIFSDSNFFNINFDLKDLKSRSVDFSNVEMDFSYTHDNHLTKFPLYIGTNYAIKEDGILNGTISLIVDTRMEEYQEGNNDNSFINNFSPPGMTLTWIKYF